MPVAEVVRGTDEERPLIGPDRAHGLGSGAHRDHATVLRAQQITVAQARPARQRQCHLLAAIERHALAALGFEGQRKRRIGLDRRR